MTRTYTIVITVLFVLLCLLGITAIIEHRKEDSLDQARIEGLKRQNETNEKRHLRAVDSITKIQVLQADSTRYYRLLKSKDQQIVKTKTESHERIIFVNLNDSARHSKLAKLYRSYTHP